MNEDNEAIEEADPETDKERTDREAKEEQLALLLLPPTEIPDQIPKWAKQSKGEPHWIPTEMEGEWIHATIDMLPLGATQKIWGEAERIIAHVEAQTKKRKEKGAQVSEGVIAQLVQDYYLLGCCKAMVRTINKTEVSSGWWDTEASQTLGNVVKPYMESLLLHRPHAKPAWILRIQGQIDAAKRQEKERLKDLKEDPRRSSADTESADSSA